MESIIENPGDIEKFSTAGESSESNSVSVQTASLKSMRKNGISIDCDYVIVTSEGLAPAFNEFMAWKRRKGIDIELVTIESIKENYTGDSISGINDDAGKLRQFLSEFYNPMKDCQYALLGGDYTIVPIRYGWSINNYDSIDHIIPTDLYFADFDGDWETDNDGRYGEPEDNVDFNPEIYVGRLLVTNADEVINWTKKLMTYEINPGNGDYSYLTKAFFTQGDQMQAGNQVSYILNKATWITDHVIYEESGGPYTQTTPSFPKGQDVVNEFNNHFGLCSFMEHGGPNNVTIAAPEYNECLDIGKYKLASMDSYSTSCEIAENGNGLDNMTNVNYPSINYSISCDNMPFDDYKTEAGERNFGESYTVISGGGGPVFIGNTRYGWVSTSYVLYGYFIDLISGGISNIGIAEATSKQSTSDGYLRFSHNLLGCPETEIWTATPTIFSSASVTQNGSSITVSTGGITADKICVMSALNTGYFQVQPNVTACTFTNVPQPYYVTITKTNYIPYLKNPTAVYIQNQTISSTAYLNCQTVSAGYNVDSSQTQGNVVIQNGAKITFNATGDILLDKGFEVQLGAFFEAK